MCFDVLTLGNHEFDEGNAVLEDFIAELQANSTSAGCPTPPAILSANIEPIAGSTLASQLLPSTTITYGDEIVGVIGLTTSTTTITSSPDSGTIFTTEVAAVEAAVADLESQGVNKIIVNTHIGYGFDISSIAAIPGVDVVVGGHTHTLLGVESEVGILSAVGGTFPTLVDGTCVVTAWEYGHGIGDLVVTFDDAGVVTECTGSMVFPFDSTNYEPSGLGDDFVTAMTAYLTGLNVFVPTTPDATVAALLQVYADEVDVLRESVIATVPEGICYERIPGQGRSNICTPEETISQGGGACNLVAKAFLDQAPSADLAIQNGGGCRTDIEQGNYTISDAFTLLPFANTLFTLEMTGAEIVQVLNEATRTALSGVSTGAYPYASGIRYDVDENNADTPVSGVEVNVRLAGEWTPIDEAASYTVVTNSFIAAGRDGYDTFATIAEVTDLFLEYGNTFVQYARQEGVLLDPPLSEYSTKSFTPLGATDPATAPPTETPITEAPTSSPTAEEGPEPTDPPSDGAMSMSLVLSMAMVVFAVIV
jgi:5'-nucleotidase